MDPTKKVVIDTSVMIAALLDPNSFSRKVLVRIVEVCWRVIMSKSLFDECTKALHAKGRSSRSLAGRFGAVVSLPEKSTWEAALIPEARYTIANSDQHVIHSAVAGGADFVIHKNPKDFERPELTTFLANNHGIEVMDCEAAHRHLMTLPVRYVAPPALAWLAQGPTS